MLSICPGFIALPPILWSDSDSHRALALFERKSPPPPLLLGLSKDRRPKAYIASSKTGPAAMPASREGKPNAHEMLIERTVCMPSGRCWD